MAESVMELLEEINEEGTTIIMVTHEPNLARRAQRNIFLRDGQLEVAESDLHLAASG
jgi:putative ABC transport system ATP-binding protein